MNLPELARKNPVHAVIVCALSGALLFGLAAQAVPDRHEASMAFTINQPERRETADYAYDGYYALRASELFADTLISWFSTPSVVRELRREAGADPDDRRFLADDAFRAKKYSSQNVVVRFSAPTPEAAGKIAAASARLMTAKTGELNHDERGEPLFILLPSEPVIAKAGPPPGKAGLAGLLLGALAGLALLYFARPPMS